MKLKYILSFFLGAMLFGAGSVYAAAFLVAQGGTGVTTIQSGKLIAGSGTNPIVTVSTTSVTCSGNTTCASFTAIGASPITISSSGGGTPGGLNTQLQYNNNGAFGGITGAVTDGTAVSLTAAHLLNPTINGAGTGLATLAYPNTSSNATITFPTVTGTLATLAGSEALTNKSVNGVTLTTGGSASTFLNGSGSYTTPAGGSSGLGTTSPWITGQIAYVNANGNVSSTATSTLTGSGVVSISNSPSIIGSSGAVATLTGGSNGQILSWLGGVPAWTATTTFSSPLIFSGGNITCQTASGSLSGCLSSTDWNTFNGKQAAGNYITALTGDVTASGPGSVAATLATVNSNVGSFGGTNSIPTFTVNGKGLITAAGSATPSIPASEITSGTFGTGNYTFSADLTVTGNATSTSFFATTASTTRLFGANLQTCNTAGSSALTYTGTTGLFGCNTITSGASFGQAFEVDASKWLSATTTNTYGINANTSGTTFGYGIGDSLLGYASSTNLDTIFGLGAGGQNATTSATVASTTVFGFNAGQALTTGKNNTLIGTGAGVAITSAQAIIAIGAGALAADQVFNGQIAIGYNAGNNITSGTGNIIIGNNVLALSSASNSTLNIGNIIFGTNVNTALTTPSNTARSTAIGIGTSSALSALAVSGGGSFGADYNFAAPTNGLIVEGNVGIGTTSPYKKLSIGGDVVIGASSSGGTLGDLYLPNLATPAGTFIAADPTGKLIATSTPSGSNSAFSPAANYATVAGLPGYGYVAGVITEVGTGALSVDGANPTVGQIVLVKNESGACTSSSGACNNGLYNVTAAGSGIAAFVLTRNSNYNSSSNVIPGIVTYVISGATLNDDFWAMISASPITIGVTSLNYTEVSGGGSSISSLGPVGALQTGATQTLATSSDTNLGLTITATGNVQTFTTNWLGTLSTARGGLGGNFNASTGALSINSGTVSAGTLSIANGGTNATSFGTSNGITAFDGTRLVNFSGYTLTSLLFSATNASTTQLTVSSGLQIPNAASSPSLGVAGYVAVDTTAASSSLRFGDGTATRSLYAAQTGSLTVASSSLTYMGAYGASGTTTILIQTVYRPTTILGAYCQTDTGTANIDFYNGSVRTVNVACSTTPTFISFGSNNTWTMGQGISVDVGRQASNPNTITVSAQIRADAD